MARIGKYPTGLASLFLIEMWERFSYYGMRAILVLYLIDSARGGLGLAASEAVAIYGIYTSAVYILALPGGWIADRFWGAGRAIMVGAVIIIIGHVLLAVSGASIAMFMLGLAAIAIGTGLLKPNISTMVGELYDEDDVGGRDAGFSLFYMGINVGAILGGLVAGYLGESWGWHWGFGAAAVAMFAGLLNFLYARRTSLLGKGAPPVRHHHPDAATARADHRATALLIGAAFLLIGGLAVAGWLDLSSAEGVARAMGVLIVTVAVGFFANIYLAGDLTQPEKRRMIVLGILFVAAAVFWSRFEQAGSSLSIFASDLTNRDLGGFEVPASWFQNLNPAFIILLTPVFAAFWLYAQSRKWDISVFVKFGLALILVGLGFLLLVPAAHMAATGVKASFLFLFGTFFIHTCAELLLSPVGLSTFSRLAPQRFASQMMGFWFLASSLGSLMAGLLAAGMDTSTPANLPALFDRLFWGSVVPGVLLILLARPLGRWAQGKGSGASAKPQA